MTPEHEDAHCDAMWVALVQLAEEGPRSTSELLERCPSWPRHARTTRRGYLRAALLEAEELGLVTSRYEDRDGYQHRVFEITEMGRVEVADLVREDAHGG